jgi:ERCC4-type nuclease
MQPTNNVKKRKNFQDNERYLVIRDSAEQARFWDFEEDERCKGTVVRKLETGDYTLEGYEKIFTIERKGSILEFATNVVEERFTRELERFRSFPHSFILLEFRIDALIDFPDGIKLPPETIAKFKKRGKFLLRRTMEMLLQYPSQIFFVDRRGKEVATSIFKRIVDHYRQK